MTVEKRKTYAVRDIPVELWIKIIGSLMGLILMIGTAFGAWIGHNIESMAKDISIIAQTVGIVDARSIRNELDINRLSDDVKKNANEISSIKGEYNGKR